VKFFSEEASDSEDSPVLSMKYRTYFQPINFQKATHICSRLISTQFSTVRLLNYLEEVLQQLTTPGKPEEEDSDDI
jgi:hypothetical protein